jgi:ubiquinone/menaquinone biosynthesis C-methylase UbiE
MVTDLSAVKPILRCPRCHSDIAWSAASARCAAADCRLNTDGAFPIVNGQPALVDFERSILERDSVIHTAAQSLIRRAGKLSLLLKRVEGGTNTLARSIGEQILAMLPEGARILVVGGGTVGNGAELLYESPRVQVIGTDIYASPHTLLIADAHQLPFDTGSVDAVWIQAVLEHVLDPAQVVAEIHRVLKPGGLVFADTPFMQQVHEGPYDFTRFTVSGHRWLFRRFECIRSGATKGAGTSLVWAVRYFARAVTGSDKIGRMATWPFFWLRFFDRANRHHGDGASGVHFFGRSSTSTLQPQDIVRFYREQKTGPSSGSG